MTATSHQPVVDGLFEAEADAVRLIATRCTSCGTGYFPQAVSCRNPDCTEKLMERAHLGDRGTLYSYTVQRYAPPAAFRIDDWSPYAIGLVEFEGGIRVMGMLAEVDLERLEIGMPMRPVVRPLFRDGEAVRTTYAFAPAELGR